MLIGPHAGTHLVEGGVMKARQILSCVLGFAAGVQGDVELTHLRQDSVTHLFQAAGSWRVPSSLVDADRRGCQAVSRGSG